MKTLLCNSVVLSTLLGLSGPALAQVQTTGARVGDLWRLDAPIRNYMAANAIPNGSLAVIASDGRLVAARSYTNYAGGTDAPGSVTDSDRVEPTTVFSRYRIASVSKLFTAVAVLQLTEYGCISDLDDPVLDYVPMVPYDGTELRVVNPLADQVTVRGLLTHDEGWGSKQTGWDPTKYDEDIQSDLGLSDLPIDQQDIISHTARRMWPILGNSGYSNYGYMLLARVIEAATGTSYESYVRYSVLRRVGVTGMTLGRTLEAGRQPGEVRYFNSHSRLSPSLVEASRPLRPSPYGGNFNLENRDGSSAWVANPLELVLFARDFMPYGPGSIFRDDANTVAQMFRDRGAGRGYGWRVDTSWNTDIGGGYQHTGRMAGTHSLLYCYGPGNIASRLDNVCLALLFNKSDTGSERDLYRSLVRTHLPSVTDWGTADLWEPVTGKPAPGRILTRPPACARASTPGVVD